MSGKIALLFGSAALACTVVFAPVLAAPNCGGQGGAKTQELRCGSHEFITGVHANGGWYVNRLKADCSGKATAWVGGPASGGSSASVKCPQGMAVYGISFRCGTYVDRIVSLYCGRIGGGIIDRTVGADNNNIRAYLNVGGTGGQSKAVMCGTNEGVQRLIVRSGDWIDNVELYCRTP